ncbi:MAG: hypothetical protein ABW007_15515 [Chitinophagaceae bacterium]
MVKRTNAPTHPDGPRMKGVITEGIAGCGKTALISSLKAELKRYGGFDVKELTHVDCDDQYARYLREYAIQERLLFHRSHISEHVLGKLLRSQSPFSGDEFFILNKIISLRFVCVLVEPPDYETYLKRKAQDTRHVREQFNENQYTEIVTSFRKSFEDIPHIHYISSTLNELEATRATIISKLIAAEHA